MQSKKIYLLGMLGLMFLLLSVEGYGQSTRSVEEILQQRSTVRNTKKKKKFSLFKKKKSESPYKTSTQLREEFDQRMKDNSKRSRKERKMANKPQYSNPLYFGHKKPPKKRPQGKKKLCKECGLVH